MSTPRFFGDANSSKLHTGSRAKPANIGPRDLFFCMHGAYARSPQKFFSPIFSVSGPLLTAFLQVSDSVGKGPAASEIWYIVSLAQTQHPPARGDFGTIRKMAGPAILVKNSNRCVTGKLKIALSVMGYASHILTKSDSCRDRVEPMHLTS